MRKVWSRLLTGVLILVLVGSACSVLRRTAPPRMSASPDGRTWLPAATPANSANGSLIPITGDNVVFLQCQFCVAQETHAVLIFPDTAIFDVQQSSATCLTADVVNGRRIVICRGAQGTAFNLSICSDPSNCLQYPVALQPCALLRGSVTTFTPVVLTPTGKHKSDNGSGSAPPPATSTPLPPSNPPPATQPPEPTKEPKPTDEPKPTKEPKPTPEPKPTKEPKPTHEPKATKKPKD